MTVTLSVHLMDGVVYYEQHLNPGESEDRMERRSSSAADELRRIARSDRAPRRVPYQ